jgi:hypothetical protein
VNAESKNIQLQYEGFLNTPLLWNETEIFNLSQFEIYTLNSTPFNSTKKPEIRLGKRVEQFAVFTFQQQKNVEILAENAHIQDEKTTIGELDCILKVEEHPIHIEIVYKFYLYDETVGTTEIEHWIGPNRRDSLFQKLTKLKDKQLPLLYNKKTLPLLGELNISAKNIIQKVYFKAQLFVPLSYLKKDFFIVNNNCIIGFYIHFKELENLNNCKFFIPKKLDWLLEIQTQTNWINFSAFTKKINEFHAVKSAPLCWLKYPNGETQKFFVVWW